MSETSLVCRRMEIREYPKVSEELRAYARTELHDGVGALLADPHFRQKTVRVRVERDQPGLLRSFVQAVVAAFAQPGGA